MALRSTLSTRQSPLISFKGLRRWVEGVEAACSVVRSPWCYVEFDEEFTGVLPTRQAELTAVIDAIGTWFVQFSDKDADAPVVAHV